MYTYGTRENPSTMGVVHMYACFLHLTRIEKIFFIYFDIYKEYFNLSVQVYQIVIKPVTMRVCGRTHYKKQVYICVPCVPNEWFRVRMMFMEEEDEKTIQRSGLQ